MITPPFLNLEEATELELSVWQIRIGGEEEEVRRCEGVTDSKHQGYSSKLQFYIMVYVIINGIKQVKF